MSPSSPHLRWLPGDPKMTLSRRVDALAAFRNVLLQGKPAWQLPPNVRAHGRAAGRLLGRGCEARQRALRAFLLRTPCTSTYKVNSLCAASESLLGRPDSSIFLPPTRGTLPPPWRQSRGQCARRAPPAVIVLRHIARGMTDLRRLKVERILISASFLYVSGMLAARPLFAPCPHHVVGRATEFCWEKP